MKDCCSTPGLLPIEQALEILKNQIQPIAETTRVSLEQSLGRILAADIIAPFNIPPHNNSAMDGYALKLSDTETKNLLPLAGKAFAGHPFKGTLPEGHCIRIMTGACIPQGADTVIMQEHTEQKETGILFNRLPQKAGNNIRKAGEDISEGTRVFTKGHKIKAQDIGLLASLGIAHLCVYRAVRVALFSTGDELKAPGEILRPGDIYDSNRFAVKAMLQKLGVEIIDLGCIPDDPKKIRETFLSANEQADAVISSGGVSVGEADYTKDILNELGKTTFWKLAIKPGKPFAFGQLPDSYFFGLPGNPVSALVTFQQLAAPALRYMMNCHQHSPLEFSATCTSPLKKAPGRKEFQRGTLTIDHNGYVKVETTGGQGSGILRSMSMADCYIVLPKDQGGVEAGEPVNVQLFDELLL
ncbi:molybdopterin molybdotransferase MoeA [Endozoicomonas sp. Mp262]|uniref:molybdopterin molybdotransferase MoeA n=1 Tax=Endozoicomonas sp. Mp262 TaxID=2919499 RepID=UPI0021DA3E11